MEGARARVRLSQRCVLFKDVDFMHCKTAVKVKKPLEVRLNSSVQHSLVNEHHCHGLLAASHAAAKREAQGSTSIKTTLLLQPGYQPAPTRKAQRTPLARGKPCLGRVTPLSWWCTLRISSCCSRSAQVTLQAFTDAQGGCQKQDKCGTCHLLIHPPGSWQQGRLTFTLVNIYWTCKILF